MNKTLLLDTETKVSSEILKTFRACGVDCTVVSTPSAALSEFFQGSKFDAISLVLNDKYVHQCRGLLSIIRNRAPDIPLILLSADGDMEKAQHVATQLGVRIWLSRMLQIDERLPKLLSLVMSKELKKTIEKTRQRKRLATFVSRPESAPAMWGI